MNTIEFETELDGKAYLTLPENVASRLPKTGHAKVIVVLEDDLDDVNWRSAAYARFMKEDDPEDAVYDKYL